MSWTHLSDTTPKARKDHRCGLCGLIILKGEVHVARRGIGDDGPCTFRMHTACCKETVNWTEDEWECSDPQEFRSAMSEK
jgi:hypothetical protein